MWKNPVVGLFALFGVLATILGALELVAPVIAAQAYRGITVLSGTITGATFTNNTERAQTLTDGATVSWNMDSGAIATVTLGGNRTLAAPTNLKTNSYILHVIQDGTGSRTITWNAVYKWPGGNAPILTTTAAARDVCTFVSNGTNLFGNCLPDVR